MSGIQLFLILLLTAGQNAIGAENIKSQQGRISFKNFDREQTYSLRGEWHFFADELVSPKQFLELLDSNQIPKKYISMGQTFAQATNHEMSNRGMGTYVLRISDLPKGKYVISGMYAISSSKMFAFSAVNGVSEKELFNRGIDKNNPEKSDPITFGPGGVFVSDGELDIFLLIQVANYHHI